MRYLTMAFAGLVLAHLAGPAAAQAPKAANKSPLDDYIQKADPEYKWKVEKTIEANSSTTNIIKLTSQAWRTAKDVDRPVWEHWLIVIKPKVLKTNKVFLMVSGGNNLSKMPEGANALVTQIAEATGSIVAELRMVPNQPLTFHGDGKGRNEDDLIGYAWDQFLKTGDATWLPRLPMVKSVVRAMDCIQEWAKTQGIAVEGFVVAGASKRGWTTWMTAAVDRRVLAIIPIVIDVANVEPSIRHHAEAYGFWAKAIGDYYQHKILQRPDDPRMKDLHRIEDPYYYRDRLTMPKYIVNASGDQFFLPDSSQFYFDNLPGEKLLRYVPNTDHSLKTLDAATSMIAYYQMLIAGKARPKLSWTFEKDGSIRVMSETPAKSVVMWQATNPKARDFRLMTIGKAFASAELKATADGAWSAKIEAPKEGWTAFFVELEYDSGGLFPLKVSTAVRVLPDTLPHKNIDLKKVPYEGNVGR
jgi:PhoPQ-activated pathogenicity-related protein